MNQVCKRSLKLCRHILAGSQAEDWKEAGLATIARKFNVE